MIPVNKALNRPLLIMGVEKRLMVLNALLSFPLVAATHFHFPAALLGLAVFIVLHLICLKVSKADPQLAMLFKRSTRYSLQGYYPARSFPAMFEARPVNSVSRPW